VSDATVLWERCLDPKRTEADRGAQSASLLLPPGTAQVTFETACRASCDWDWSYWSAALPITDGQAN
jgi:hypothetical protein